MRADLHGLCVVLALYVRFYQELQTAAKSMDTGSLKEYRHKWEHIQDSSDTAQEAKQNVFKLIDAELRNRKD